MAYLITPAEINALAYLSPIPEEDFKANIIAQVQEVDVRAILQTNLYDAVITTPEDYTQLINDNIKPYMAHRIKESILSMSLSEDPGASTRATSLIQDSLKAASDMAGQAYQTLNLYIARNFSIPTRWVAGIIIDTIDAPPPPAIPDDPPEGNVPQHGHNCTEIFLPDPLAPETNINLCVWANRVEDRLLIDYFYNSADNVAIDTDVYTPVVSLLTPDLPAGTYEFKLAFTWSLNAITRSIYFHFSLDGGSTWTEWISEPKDITDDKPFAYFFPFDHPGGILDCRFESRLEDSADTGLISFSDIIIDRKS